MKTKYYLKLGALFVVAAILLGSQSIIGFVEQTEMNAPAMTATSQTPADR